jgi:hypothetical protein
MSLLSHISVAFQWCFSGLFFWSQIVSRITNWVVFISGSKTNRANSDQFATKSPPLLADRWCLYFATCATPCAPTCATPCAATCTTCAQRAQHHAPQHAHHVHNVRNTMRRDMHTMRTTCAATCAARHLACVPSRAPTLRWPCGARYTQCPMRLVELFGSANDSPGAISLS